MRNLTENNKSGGDLAEEQPSLIRPLPVRASANVAGSSWKKPSGNINYGLNLGVNADELASSSATKPYHSAPAENVTPISEEKNINIIGGVATSGDLNIDEHTVKTDEGQAYQPASDCSNNPEMDPRRLNRYIIYTHVIVT